MIEVELGSLSAYDELASRDPVLRRLIAAVGRPDPFAWDGGEVAGGWESFAGFGFAVGDCAAELAGDLFVDASNSLWFCKGGASWKQLA